MLVTYVYFTAAVIIYIGLVLAVADIILEDGSHSTPAVYSLAFYIILSHIVLALGYHILVHHILTSTPWI